MLTKYLTNLSDTNRRHLQRNHSLMYLKIIDRDSNITVGHLVDESDGGILLICDADSKPNKELNIRILLPKDLGFERDYIDAEIELRWTKLDKNEDYRVYGCQFTNLEEEDFKLLMQLSEQLTFEGVTHSPIEPVL